MEVNLETIKSTEGKTNRHFSTETIGYNNTATFVILYPHSSLKHFPISTFITVFLT